MGGAFSTGGTQASSAACEGRVPIHHRPAGSACPQERAPGSVFVNTCSPGWAGLCAQDADCTAGTNGRCLPNSRLNCAGQCYYDECFSDSDCPASHRRRIAWRTHALPEAIAVSTRIAARAASARPHQSALSAHVTARPSATPLIPTPLAGIAAVTATSVTRPRTPAWRIAIALAATGAISICRARRGPALSAWVFLEGLMAANGAGHHCCGGYAKRRADRRHRLALLTVVQTPAVL